MTQPWAWLTAEGLRTIDQRLWADDYRGRVAIHAGKTIDEDQVKALRRLGVPLPAKLERQAFLAVAELVEVRQLVDSLEDARDSTCSSLTSAQLLELFARQDAPFSGLPFNDKGRKAYAFVFRNVERVAPVPAQGDRLLWVPSEAQVQDLRDAWTRHKRAQKPAVSPPS